MNKTSNYFRIFPTVKKATRSISLSIMTIEYTIENILGIMHHIFSEIFVIAMNTCLM